MAPSTQYKLNKIGFSFINDKYKHIQPTLIVNSSHFITIHQKNKDLFVATLMVHKIACAHLDHGPSCKIVFSVFEGSFQLLGIGI